MRESLPDVLRTAEMDDQAGVAVGSKMRCKFRIDLDGEELCIFWQGVQNCPRSAARAGAELNNQPGFGDGGNVDDSPLQEPGTWDDRPHHTRAPQESPQECESVAPPKSLPPEIRYVGHN